MYGLNYTYTITGIEFGLKHSSDFKLLVAGACRTEYGWLDKSSNTTVDIYNLFNNHSDEHRYTVSLVEPCLSLPPRTVFKLPWDDVDQALTGNVTYAVMATLNHRTSTSRGTDPWYLIEEYYDENLNMNQIRIKDHRPALSCWQKDTWSCCGGETVKNGILDAQSSSIQDDMTRLIVASYISTLNILGESTRFVLDNKKTMKMLNQFYNTSSQSVLQDGADDFVVFASDVQTFNLTGLIAATSIATFLLLAKLLLMAKLHFHGNSYAGLPDDEEMDPNQEISPFNKNRWARFKAFSAVHLLRNSCQDGNGAAQKDWKCSESLPEPREQKPLQLVKCSRGDYGCAGHLAVAPELLELAPRTRRPRHFKVSSLLTLLGDSDIPLHTTNEPPKTTQSGGTATPFNDFSSSETTPQQEDLHVWLPDMQAGYNPYFPQTQPAAVQQYHDDTAIGSAPLLQQPGYYYTRG